MLVTKYCCFWEQISPRGAHFIWSSLPLSGQLTSTHYPSIFHLKSESEWSFPKGWNLNPQCDAKDPPISVTSLQSQLRAMNWNRGLTGGLLLHLLVQGNILGQESREYSGQPCEVQQACWGVCQPESDVKGRGALEFTGPPGSLTLALDPPTETLQASNHCHRRHSWEQLKSYDGISLLTATK